MTGKRRLRLLPLFGSDGQGAELIGVSDGI